MDIEEKILEPYLMIKASAGSGKTYQLSNRIIGKIGVREEDPQRMIALTFTRKAAGEFADDLLDKLCKAVLSADAGKKLQEEVNGVFDVENVLEKVVRALPRMQLGTMDSFFSQVVRGFQYELGLSGGDFDLIEGPQLELAMEEIIREVIADVFAEGDGDEFVHAFRRATRGREDSRVASNLEEFVRRWHGLWKAGGDEVNSMARFGGRLHFSDFNLPEPERWEKDKHRLVGAMLVEIEAMENWTHSKQEQVLIGMCGKMKDHTVGSGVLKNSGFFSRVLEWINGGGPPVLKHYKEFELSAKLAELLQEAVQLIARCETAAAIGRTEGIGQLIKRVNVVYEQRLKNRGLLSFDDVKILMGAWQTGEDARLQREMVDFRLDGTYDHWFLDEFQDTSQDQWDGLKPLLDEVSSDPEGIRSLFIIGDSKQAIYGWRGGKVALFEQAQKIFRMDSLPMDKSYRSCGAVLSLVNAVCCNDEMISHLFGKNVSSRWDCNEHTPADDKKKGEARVEVVPEDEMYTTLTERLEELDIGNKKLSCGILLRTRKEVQQVADHLRRNQFDVIEDGRRRPMEDNPMGVALFALISWLADPADRYSRNLVGMSPIEKILRDRFNDGKEKGMKWSRWEELLKEAHLDGFAAMIRRLLEPLLKELPPFGKRRAEDILGALEQYDLSGSGTVRDARDWLAALEIVQPPTDASIQVMTIHASKGLGFDVVMLPMFSDKQIPARNYYAVAQSREGWILQPPASWVRSTMDVLEDLERDWEEDQQYEALCLLYVAMTRARLALNIFLLEEPPGREDADEWASPTNLIRRSIPEDGFEEVDPNWLDETEPREEKPLFEVQLGKKMPLCERSTPSGTKAGDVMTSNGGTGMKIGSEVHQLFEEIGWLEVGEIPDMPRSRAGMIVEETLADTEIHNLFEKASADVELYREQSLEVIQDGKWLSGIVDRMHVCRGEDGEINEIYVIDYKTDAAPVEEISQRYEGQMQCYRRALEKIFGVEGERVRCLLIATSHKAVIEHS